MAFFQHHTLYTRLTNPQVVEALTLTEIFRDNHVLCNKVQESEIQHFIRCIEKDRDIRYLKFLQTVVKCNAVCIKRAQDLVMAEVRSSESLTDDLKA